MTGRIECLPLLGSEGAIALALILSLTVPDSDYQTTVSYLTYLGWLQALDSVFLCSFPPTAQLCLTKSALNSLPDIGQLITPKAGDDNEFVFCVLCFYFLIPSILTNR